jgi:flagellar basal body rod protein FlgG
MTNGVGGANLSSALYAGVQGYNQGAEQVQKASLDIASANTGRQELQADANGQQQLRNQNNGNGNTANINNSVVELISGTNQAEASAKVIKTADEMLGTIIDTFA